MKIIKRGTLPTEKAAEMHCSNCGCVFEASRYEFDYVVDKRGDDLWKITCPTLACENVLYKYTWE